MSKNLLDTLLASKSAATQELRAVEREISELHSQISRMHDKLSYYQGLVVDLEDKIRFHAHKQIDSGPVRINALASKRNTPLIIEKNALSPRSDTNRSVKEMVIQILRGSPNGYDVRTILQFMKSLFGADIPRTTVSPQLSRMKHEGFLELDGDAWKLSSTYRDYITHKGSLQMVSGPTDRLE